MALGRSILIVASSRVTTEHTPQHKRNKNNVPQATSERKLGLHSMPRMMPVVEKTGEEPIW